MSDLFRETAAGQIIRFISRRKLLPYPEELPGFQFQYPAPQSLEKAVLETEKVSIDAANIPDDLEKAKLESDSSSASDPPTPKNEFILVDWYSADDPANPQNWSTKKKVLVAFEIWYDNLTSSQHTVYLQSSSLYTFTIYIGSAIYAPSITGVMEDFDVSEVVASLGLALYVMSYGLGALLWSPLSEIPVLGRNSIYIVTFFIFVILLIPTALAENIGGLLVLRFLLGWFGSPCLATGAAGFSDMFDFLKLPYCLALWACSGTMAPSMGPIVAGFSVPIKGWRWSLWENLWLSAPVFIFLFMLLPETSSDNILLRRAVRLRRVTGNANIRSQSEITQQHMSAREMAFDALIKPWEMNILDPAVLFTTLYASLCYAIFYTFFEAFPLVFPVMYDFSSGESGLAFLSITIGVVLTIPVCLLHYAYYVEPGLKKNGAPEPEVWLKPGLIGNILVPIGLFIFAWTARSSTHWIAPIIGVALSQSGSYIILNVLFTYIPNIYPKYAASLFAANDAARSTLAGAAILFGRPLFVGLGVAGGVSLLAGLAVLCSVGFYALYHFGGSMRRRSRFAVA
ncbi:hypothetical protein V494_02360 [Pseudogymnoascus sp. VKM F-4513 (FW-928)]|nr:hypothetical protein V494_02360 [Pseudogymnoascus sp. VKM F-4513 (FW-928)]